MARLPSSRRCRHCKRWRHAEIWSNGLFPSTDIVFAQNKRNRPVFNRFFMDPDDKVVVEPVTTCIENNRISRFAPVQVGTYLKRKIADSQVHK
ncbi:MAG: hypothetical protein CM15mP120_04390 [Pseudomonadota bacterium]|nr:MAG: hypothetical protein CM15mP120_04390 [Pseudomonadota bacterium]